MNERCCDCKTRLLKDNETGGKWCPVCSFNNARRAHLSSERDAAELRAEVKRLTGKLEAVVATLDAANDELHATQDMNKSLLSQLDDERARLAIHRGEYHQEWQAETPYGQMLDGLGDEVEP